MKITLCEVLFFFMGILTLLTDFMKVFLDFYFLNSNENQK